MDVGRYFSEKIGTFVPSINNWHTYCIICKNMKLAKCLAIRGFIKLTNEERIKK